jgi:acid phosphatase class B
MRAGPLAALVAHRGAGGAGVRLLRATSSGYQRLLASPNGR